MPDFPAVPPETQPIQKHLYECNTGAQSIYCERTSVRDQYFVFYIKAFNERAKFALFKQLIALY